MSSSKKNDVRDRARRGVDDALDAQLVMEPRGHQERGGVRRVAATRIDVGRRSVSSFAASSARHRVTPARRQSVSAGVETATGPAGALIGHALRANPMRLMARRPDGCSPGFSGGGQ